MSQARVSVKIAEICGFIPPPGTYSTDHEGTIDFLASRKFRVGMLDSTDGDRAVGFVDVDEGIFLSRRLHVPLTSLAQPGCLQNSIEHALTGLNLRPTYALSIARDIASYVNRIVGGTAQEFYTDVYLEVTETELVRGPPDLILFLYQSYNEISPHEEDLDATDRYDYEVVHQPVPDLRSLLREYQRRLRASTVPVTLEGPRGGMEEAIQKLKATSFSAIKGADHNLGRCSICLEDLDQETDNGKGLVTKTPCRHLFHESCIITWVERSLTCPLCRQELSC